MDYRIYKAILGNDYTISQLENYVSKAHQLNNIWLNNKWHKHNLKNIKNSNKH